LKAFTNSVNETLKKEIQGYMLFSTTALKEMVNFKKKNIVVDQKFLEVSLNDIHGLPPNKEIDLIDFIYGAGSIFTCIYKMSPFEIIEMKRQLEELLEKQFFCLSVSPWIALVLLVKKKMKVLDCV